VNQFIRRAALVALAAILSPSHLHAQSHLQSASKVRGMLIEDSLTPAKTQLRNYVAELRDTLVGVEAVQARIARARAAGGQTSVVMSSGRELARHCLIGAVMVGATAKRVEPMGTPDPRGETAMAAYRNGLATLQNDLRDCAHFDSLTMATRPFDQQKLENIATAARDAIMRYDQVRDALMKLMAIDLPVHGNIYH
jgi:hypothetical protein